MMQIGNKIKALRKQRGITQEQLANSIGISFQAVSKWENNIALPDIALAPVLASYFGVSMDELFDFNLKEIESAMEVITEEAYRFRESDPAKSREILEEGLRKYPDNDILRNNLLYVINYAQNPDETIAVASALIEKTNAADIKYDALRFLAYAYKAKGDLESAEAAIEQIPEFYFTKLTEAAYVLEGQAKMDAAQKQKGVSLENLLEMQSRIAECHLAEGNTAAALTEYEQALGILDLLEANSDYWQGYRNFFCEKIEKYQAAV